MPFASLTRRVTFAAAHRYRRPDWSDARNAEVFGPCAHPSYHGHSYTCLVTVRGPVDRTTGFCVDLALLDRVLHEEVRARFDHRNLNVDVPEFAEGALIPTSEEVAMLVAARVQARLDAAHTGGGADGGADAPRVTRVEVAEDETMRVVFEPDRDA
jgi:6-pyruvoyltetrahydropterin/6-carboxytetrahydropterin synthase